MKTDKLMRKVLSLFMCMVLCICSMAYADSVIIGSAPTDNSKQIAQNATTTYLQNTYQGPGTTPNSANTLGTTPISLGVTGYTSTYINNNAYNSQVIDNNNVSDAGPVTHTISSPAANNQALMSNRTTSAIISNGAMGANNANNKISGSSTDDIGPTFYENPGPGADPSLTNSAAVVGPGTKPQQPITNTTVQKRPVQTVNTAAMNSDVIIYQTNNTITKVLPTISAPAALCLNATTRQIYYAKGGFDMYPPAALANLVTAYLLLQYKGLEANLTVTANAVTNLESGANTAGLKAGDTITVRDAIAAMFVKSCCDVANVAAENVSGSINSFVALMNQTIKSWGCLHTVFMNPTGLNNDMQKTTTYDMAIIMDKVSANPALKQLLTLTAWTLPATAHRKAVKITSKNSLLTKYQGIGAARMGYTSKAKYTMAAEIDYNGQRLIAIVLKANNTQINDTTKLLNFAKVACIEAQQNGSATRTYQASQMANINRSYNAAYNTAAYNAAFQNGVPISGYSSTEGETNIPANTANVSNNDMSTAVEAKTDVNANEGTWKQDGKGWFYIKADGSKASNEWVRHGGKLYCVDSSGYMITGWREFSNGKMYYFEPSNGEFKYNTWVNLSTGAYYLQSDGSLAKAEAGQTKNIVTTVGTYTIDDTGKAIAKV